MKELQQLETKMRACETELKTTRRKSSASVGIDAAAAVETDGLLPRFFLCM